MEIFYILSLIFLIIGFMLCKKSEEKINFVKWIIIAVVSIYAYNIVIGMVLGLLNITSHIWLLAIINILFGILLGAKAVLKHDFQKYEITKYDIAGLVVIFIMFSVMFVKDLYIYNGDISHYAIDSAIHYRAGKHYAENLKIFINVEDKTFFNFNIMQTGAYINDGIFMNIVHGLTGLEYAYIYQIFETLTMFIGGLAFYAFFVTKIKTKRGFIATLSLFGLYMYGYPYNSWFYGFSYLSVGIVMTALLLSVVESLYSDEKIRKIIAIPLIIFAGFGLIFSYCLFVPPIFAAICIFCFLKDISNKETKKYLKIFGKKTLIVTGLLILVTIAGICYLFIPSFFIEGQTDLVSALKVPGGMYKEKYENFLVYIPFAILYFAEIIKRIKNKTLRYQDVFAVIVVGYTALLYIGMMTGHVSDYYMLKTYYILWLAVFGAIIDLVNEYIDEKLFRIDVVLIFALYVILVMKRIEIGLILKIILFLELAIFTVLPQLIKNIDLTKFKKLPEKFRKKFEIKPIKISGYAYVIIWTIFVCSWVLIKAGHVIGEEEKHSLPNFVGMYYSENCFYRKLVDLDSNFNKNEIEVVLYARENLKDMTADNTELLTYGNYARIWTTAMLEINSDKIKYEKITGDPHVYSVEEALENEEKKYMVKVVSKDQNRMNEFKEVIKEVKQNEQIEVLFENENGFVAKINR